MVRIGYQGDIGSNSEEAALRFVRDYLGLQSDEYELVPLIESQRVVNKLKDKRIDYGVMAVRNSIAGIVKETEVALKGECFPVETTIVIPIHHCVFIKQGIDESVIDTVTSHIQALHQTRKTRELWHPEWCEIVSNDTASAARALAEGKLPSCYAVICRKNAGEKY